MMLDDDYDEYAWQLVEPLPWYEEWAICGVMLLISLIATLFVAVIWAWEATKQLGRCIAAGARYIWDVLREDEPEMSEAELARMLRKRLSGGKR